eukprot:TRINITY_DN30180_c0_g1_i1.p1 TRINITY_DN30180_c0_g1~~TRINITY_DN30180_c0_g1_i1.p1  ORF type:complete len:555 (+),score=161.66 TRINITY_DN30180_c0_g1_i1:58-1722(+)
MWPLGGGLTRSPERRASPKAVRPAAAGGRPAGVRVPLSCGACCEVMQDPVGLDCGHSFCAPCLTRATHTAEGGTPKGKGVQCPQCDERSASVQPLPAPPARGGAAAPPRAEVCDWCEQAAPDAYCEDCKTSLCRACVGLVHRKRNMSAHSIVPLAAKPNTFARCEVPGHDRAFVKYYCKTCGEAACPQCATERHGDCVRHEVVGILTVVGHVADRLRRRMGRVEEEKHRLKELVAGNHRTRLQFNTTAVAYEQQVRHVFAALRRQLQREEDAMVAELRASFQSGRAGLLASTDALMEQCDTANGTLDALSTCLQVIDNDIGNGAAAAAISSLKREAEEFPAPALEGITVPRGAGFRYSVPEYHIPSLQKAAGLSMDLKPVHAASTLLQLTFPPPPAGDVSVDLSPEGTVLSVGKLCGWASIRAKQELARSTYQWKLRLHTFNVMIGVASPDDARPDLHKGRGFFWYTDIQGPPFGVLGSPTPAFDALPPLHSLGCGPVDVVLKYDADAGTLAARVAGRDCGVVGERIAPPVCPAVSFIDDAQKVVVVSDMCSHP